MNDRYSRQILLDEVGEEGQKRLLKSTVAIVGCGGLGAIVASYLAGAGVGHLVLIDGDIPNISNVHRQILYSGHEKDSKSLVLKEKLAVLNPDVSVESFSDHLRKENINNVLTGVDLILECTDDIMCKYLVNDFAAIEQIPLVYGAIYKYEGYVSSFMNSHEDDTHLRDIFPHPDETIPTCAEVGVLNTLAGIIALLQANEALKILIGIGDVLSGNLLTYDCLSNRQMIISIKKSWDQDLEEYFEASNYLPMDCSFVGELSIEGLMAQRDKFILVSVMSESEHQSIDDATFHNALLTRDADILKAADKPIVLYCKYGKSSKQLAANLINAGVDAELYSLEGGYQAFQKFKASN